MMEINVLTPTPQYCANHWFIIIIRCVCIYVYMYVCVCVCASSLLYLNRLIATVPTAKKTPPTPPGSGLRIGG